MGNKKGAIGDQSFFVIFFLILLYVSVVVVAGVVLFFGDGYDFRESDARVINYIAGNCLWEKGEDAVRENFFANCNIKKESMGSHAGMKICKNLELKECLEGNTAVAFYGGNFESCGFNFTKTNDQYSQCYISKFKIKEDNYLVVGASSQKGWRVKQ